MGTFFPAISEDAQHHRCYQHTSKSLQSLLLPRWQSLTHTFPLISLLNNSQSTWDMCPQPLAARCPLSLQQGNFSKAFWTSKTKTATQELHSHVCWLLIAKPTSYFSMCQMHLPFTSASMDLSKLDMKVVSAHRCPTLFWNSSWHVAPSTPCSLLLTQGSLERNPVPQPQVHLFSPWVVRTLGKYLIPETFSNSPHLFLPVLLWQTLKSQTQPLPSPSQISVPA